MGSLSFTSLLWCHHLTTMKLNFSNLNIIINNFKGLRISIQYFSGRRKGLKHMGWPPPSAPKRKYVVLRYLWMYEWNLSPLFHFFYLIKFSNRSIWIGKQISILYIADLSNEFSVPLSLLLFELFTLYHIINLYFYGLVIRCIF